jgi:hypothetical protein
MERVAEWVVEVVVHDAGDNTTAEIFEQLAHLEPIVLADTIFGLRAALSVRAVSKDAVTTYIATLLTRLGRTRDVKVISVSVRDPLPV